MWHFGGWIKDITEPPGGEVGKSSFLCKSLREGWSGGGGTKPWRWRVEPPRPVYFASGSLFKCCGSLCALIFFQRTLDRPISYRPSCLRARLYVSGNMSWEPRTSVYLPVAKSYFPLLRASKQFSSLFVCFSLARLIFELWFSFEYGNAWTVRRSSYSMLKYLN